MAVTVEEGFRTFLSRLTPSTQETDAAKSHRASIEECLETNFEMTRFFRTGSFGNGTSIRGHSDVDYFASIPRKNLGTNSLAMLFRVCHVLNSRFPNTGVTVRTPAILIPFGTDASESTEVVPAAFIKRDNRSYDIYGIANGVGGWKRASPEAHNAYVAHVDAKLGRKVRPLIRFLKAWKYYSNVPVSSFYLELRVAVYSSRESFIEYSCDVRKFLKGSWASKLAPIRDPMRVSGEIRSCSSKAEKAEAFSKLAMALGRANKARMAEEAGRIPEAFYWWNLVFDDHFPAYR